MALVRNALAAGGKGAEEAYHVLEILEFTSARKRMRWVVLCIFKYIYLFCIFINYICIFCIFILYIICFLGVGEEAYRVLESLEFTSALKRMR